MLSMDGNVPGLSAFSTSTSRAPAMPAIIPAITNACSLTLVTDTEADWAARALFSDAISTRPARALRRPMVTRMTTTRNARHVRYIW